MRFETVSGHVEVTAEPKVAENVKKKKVIHKMYTVVCFFFFIIIFYSY